MLVIDAIMSAGKTTFIIDKIKKNLDSKWCVITPFVSETDRIAEATGLFQPDESCKFVSKTKQVLEALRIGKSVVVTHSLFLLLSEESLKLLVDYQIVIDEVLPSCQHLPIKTAEVAAMIREGAVAVEDTSYGYKRLVINTPDELRGTKLLAFHHSRLFGGGELILSENNILMMLLPAYFFDKHERITLLTYNFDKTDLSCYLKFRKIEVTKKTLVDGKLRDWTFVDGSSFRDLITVIDNGKMNETSYHKHSRYTKAWYSRLDNEQLNKVKKNLVNFFKTYCNNSPSSKNLFTVFEETKDEVYLFDGENTATGTATRSKKKLRDLIMTNPYKQIGRKRFCYEFSHIPELIKEGSFVSMDEERKRMVWLPLNAKGTNLYADRNAVAYMVNLNITPAITNFFNNVLGEAPCNDTFALNMMTQWLFRSAIRKGEHITLYVPSKRMRHLLLTWLGYTQEELF